VHGMRDVRGGVPSGPSKHREENEMRNSGEKYEYVIVGGGPAARILNHYLHMFNPDVSVAVFRDEERTANKCSIPYMIDGHVRLDKGGLSSDEIVTKFGSRLVKEKVVSGDPEEKYVVTDAGTRFSYEKLILATGSEHAVPPVQGVDLPEVLKFRDIGDFRSVLLATEQKQSFVVLGAGYLGLEIAAALRRLEKDVTVVEMLPHVMGDRYDAEFASQVEAALQEKGVRLSLGKKAVQIGGDNKVEFVKTEDGTRIKTQAVLLAAGVKPRMEYAEELGLETARDGIIVDDFFRTNVPDIYAIGDCVQTRSFVTGEPFPGKLGSNAARMARTLAMNLNGYEIPFNGVINPACTKIFDLRFCSAGHTEKDAKDQGIDVQTSRTDNTDIYDNMPHSRPVSVKLTFQAANWRLIGGEFVGSANFAGFADCLGQLIYRRAKIEDVVTMDFSVHPELTPNPARSYLMFAAQNALRQQVSARR